MAPEAASYRVTLVPVNIIDPDDIFESVLYVVSDCADIEQTCVGADDSVGSGSPEEVVFTAAAGVPYFIIVDGYKIGAHTGKYTLLVEAAP